jgi:hypothetical protein
MLVALRQALHSPGPDARQLTHDIAKIRNAA